MSIDTKRRQHASDYRMVWGMKPVNLFRPMLTRGTFVRSTEACLIMFRDKSEILHRAFCVQKAATGRYHLINWNWGTPAPLHPELGRENASVWRGGQRRRSSQMPCCNGVDTAKVRQGEFTRKAVCGETRTHGLGRGKDREILPIVMYIDFGVIYQRTAQAVVDGWEMQYAEMKYGQKKWTLEEAQFFIDGFLGGFPQMQAWIEAQKQRVFLPEVFSETAFGFRRRFPLIMRRTVAEIQRQLVNSPIQGTASQITFMALHRIQEEFYQRWPGSAHVLLTVHDSIASEVRDDLVEEAIKVKKKYMEHVDLPDWNVPLRADVKISKISWGDAKEIEDLVTG